MLLGLVTGFRSFQSCRGTARPSNSAGSAAANCFAGLAEADFLRPHSDRSAAAAQIAARWCQRTPFGLWLDRLQAAARHRCSQSVLLDPGQLSVFFTYSLLPNQTAHLPLPFVPSDSSELPLRRLLLRWLLCPPPSLPDPSLPACLSSLALPPPAPIPSAWPDQPTSAVLCYFPPSTDFLLPETARLRRARPPRTAPPRSSPPA